MDSNNIPGSTEIIGTTKVAVSKSEPTVNNAPIISPLLVFEIFIDTFYETFVSV
jgi:hypothetical protein